MTTGATAQFIANAQASAATSSLAVSVTAVTFINDALMLYTLSITHPFLNTDLTSQYPVLY